MTTTATPDQVIQTRLVLHPHPYLPTLQTFFLEAGLGDFASWTQEPAVIAVNLVRDWETLSSTERIMWRLFVAIAQRGGDIERLYDIGDRRHRTAFVNAINSLMAPIGDQR